MKKLAVLAFGLISAMPAPVPAAPGSTSTSDPNEVICRITRVTGSRLGASRRCATRAQWAEDDRTQRAQLTERQLRQTQPSCMRPAERMAAAGRYASTAIGGGAIGCE
jgi:predicted nucleic acid binding AN1-type Zn finger protein